MLLACVVCCASTSAQIRTVTFTGRDRTNQHHIPLSRVNVFNLDQLWEEILYYPDTVLILGTVGIDDYDSRQNVQLMQNVPNPFDGTTEFALQLPDGGDVFLEIYDITGKLAVVERFTALPVGTHLFQATLSSPQTYLLSAKVDNGKMTIKMVNEGHGAGNTIHHLGMTDKNGDFTLYLKNEKASSSYPFHLGDEMQYEGFALLDGTQWESAVVTQPQVYNDTVPLLFDVTVPTVQTSPVADITASTATCGGVVTSDGNVPVTARGVCWDTLPNPTVDDSFTADSIGVGSFTSYLSGLADGTTYYVRAYATNSVGTAYGEEREFSTLLMLSPTVTTNTVTDVTVSSATCGGVVTSDGNVPVTARGVCWDTSPNPTVDDSFTADSIGVGSFTSYLSGLADGTTYYVRAYATNSVGTAYGEEREFSTLPMLSPTVTTNTVSNITVSSATCGGVVTSDGNVPVTARGVCWDTLPNPTVDDSFTADSIGVGSFTSYLSGLADGTTYYVRAYATNGVGTAYGEQRTFTTLSLPLVTTDTVSNITGSTAVCGGNVISEGDAPVTARGVCWSTSINPTVDGQHTTIYGSGTGSFSSNLSGLTGGTTYYVRAYATSSLGTLYGEQRTFTTAFTCGNIIADYDGNSYNTVQIGNQCWMKENLKTAHLNNGVSIPLVQDSTSWGYSSSPAYCYYNQGTYGCLYNYYAVESGQLCPPGWHVPTYNEVHTILSYTLGSSDAGGKMKTTGTTYWLSPNTGATNSSGFSARGSGIRYPGHSISGIKERAVYWTSNTYNDDYAYDFYLCYDQSYLRLYGVSAYDYSIWKRDGLSVRCLRDDEINEVSNPCPGVPTVTDYDGNVYHTVQIGGQCWMKENLRTTRYSDGTEITLAASNTDFSSTVAYRYNPGNHSFNVSTYGYLYNWPAVMNGETSSSSLPSNVQGICPMGWHVPSDAEWTQLTNYVSGQSEYVCNNYSGYIAKALASNTGWAYYTDTCAVGFDLSSNNATGFSAVPAGYHYGSSFPNSGSSAYFWSSTEYSSSDAYNRRLTYNNASVNSNNSSKSVGYSVRCLRDGAGNPPNAPTGVSATLSGTQIQVSWNSVSNATSYKVYRSSSVNGSYTLIGSPTSNYYNDANPLTGYNYYKVKAVNSTGESAFSNSAFCNYSGAEGPCSGAATVYYDGVTYNTVQIGQQCWMKENLRTTHYADGTSIPSGGSNTSETTGYYYDYSSSDIPLAQRGYLYNWPAVMHGAASSSANPSGVQGICPDGWHVPSDAEWTQLTDYVSSQSQYVCGSNNTYIAKALASTEGWETDTFSCAVGYNQASNNATGFSAVPAGYHYGSIFGYSGTYAYFWSSTEYSSSYAYYRRLTYNTANVGSYNNKFKSNGSSVRCLRDGAGNPPNAPTGVSATLSGTQIQVSWNSVSNATSYKVYRSSSVNGSYTLIGSPTSNYYNDANPLTGYNYYKVKAVNSTGESAFSSVASCNYAAVSHTISISLITDRYGSDITWQVKDVSTNTILASGGPYSDLSSNGTTIQDIPTIYVDGTGCYVFIINDSYGDGLCCSSGNGSYSVSYDGVVIGSGGNAFSQETYYLNCPNVDEKSCPAAPTVTDHEGNMYATVQIGSQCWMRDNLRTTTSPNTGTYLIPAAGTTYTYTGKQARWYNNDSTTYAPMNYGLLYNWNAAVDTFNTTYGETSVNTNYSNAVSVSFTSHRQGICPVGWHLPSDAEWTQLTNYVGGQSEYVCGDTNINIAKALASQEGWYGYYLSPDFCAVGNNETIHNATGFSAVPAGLYDVAGSRNAGTNAQFWSSTQSGIYWAYSIGLCGGTTTMYGDYRWGRNDGYSVRCLRD